MLIFYIHGFNSGPKVSKEVEINEILKTRLIPLSYDSSRECQKNLNDLISQVNGILSCKDAFASFLFSDYEETLDQQQWQWNEDVVIMGTSLGAFYAKRIAEYFHAYCVMINPVVDPVEELRRFIGEHVNFVSGKRYRFDEQTLLSYKAYRQTSLDSPTLIYVSSSDELLINNYEKVCSEFETSALIIETKTSHQVAFNELPDLVLRLTELTQKLPYKSLSRYLKLDSHWAKRFIYEAEEYLEYNGAFLSTDGVKLTLGIVDDEYPLDTYRTYLDAHIFIEYAGNPIMDEPKPLWQLRFETAEIQSKFEFQAGEDTYLLPYKRIEAKSFFARMNPKDLSELLVAYANDLKVAYTQTRYANQHYKNSLSIQEYQDLQQRLISMADVDDLLAKTVIVKDTLNYWGNGEFAECLEKYQSRRNCLKSYWSMSTTIAE